MGSYNNSNEIGRGLALEGLRILLWRSQLFMAALKTVGLGLRMRFMGQWIWNLKKALCLFGFRAAFDIYGPEIEPSSWREVLGPLKKLEPCSSVKVHRALYGFGSIELFH